MIPETLLSLLHRMTTTGWSLSSWPWRSDTAIDIMPHRVWAIILLGVGVAVFAMARQIATWKTRAWAKFYAQHPGAAKKNPLSKHAGSDRSVRLGTFMWRLVGGAIAGNGLLRL